MVLTIITVVMCFLGFLLAVTMAAHIEGRTGSIAEESGSTH
jgi:hypothetical protein